MTEDAEPMLPPERWPCCRFCRAAVAPSALYDHQCLEYLLWLCDQVINGKGEYR